MKAFNRKRKVIASVVTIQQTITRVCRGTDNYFVALSSTSVWPFLLQGLDPSNGEARFAGYAISRITILCSYFPTRQITVGKVCSQKIDSSGRHLHPHSPIYQPVSSSEKMRSKP